MGTASWLTDPSDQQALEREFSMRQGFLLGSVSVTMSSWGIDINVHIVLARNEHPGSYQSQVSAQSDKGLDFQRVQVPNI